MIAWPVSPLIKPINNAPSSSIWAPSVKHSRNQCPQPCAPLPWGIAVGGTVFGVAGPTLDGWCAMRRAQIRASKIAGVSISTIAAAMCPPNAMPLASRYWVAVTKVTALTEPYAAATAAALSGSMMRRSTA